jgi:hypothetical protein
VTAALLTLLLAAPVQTKWFSIEVPEGWTVVEKSDTRIHIRRGDANIQLMAVTKGAPKKTGALAGWWRAQMRNGFPDPVGIAHVKYAFGGETAVAERFTSGQTNVFWAVARKGDVAYGLHVTRIGDEFIEEVQLIPASVKLLAKAAPKPVPPKREVLVFRHYRLECVKPAGMTARDARDFDDSEKRNGQIARFDELREQSRLTIRVFAHLGKKDPEKLRQVRIDWFKKQFEKHREPAIGKKWKVRLAQKSGSVHMVALAGTKRTETWYAAQCRNGFSYEVQIYRSGVADYDARIADFLKHFKPLQKREVPRSHGP